MNTWLEKCSAVLSLRALSMLVILLACSSCAVTPVKTVRLSDYETQGPPVYALPQGAEVVRVDDQQLWVRDGIYYRRHPRGGYMVYRPKPVIHRTPQVASGPRVSVLPIGARVVMVHGERCWVHRGSYYRRHARGGYVIFTP